MRLQPERTVCLFDGGFPSSAVFGNGAFRREIQSSLQSSMLMNFRESSSQPSAVMMQPRSQRRP